LASFFILTSSTGVYKHNNAVHLFKMVEFFKYAEIFLFVHCKVMSHSNLNLLDEKYIFSIVYYAIFVLSTCEFKILKLSLSTIFTVQMIGAPKFSSMKDSGESRILVLCHIV